MKCKCGLDLTQVYQSSPRLFCQNSNCKVGYYDNNSKKFEEITFKIKKNPEKISIKVSSK